MFDIEKDVFFYYINWRIKKKIFNRETYYGLIYFVHAIVMDVTNHFTFAFRSRKVACDFSDKILVFANSVNNYEALKFVMDKCPEAVLVTSRKVLLNRPGVVGIQHLLFTLLNLKKYLFFFYILIHPKHSMHPKYWYLIIKKFDFVKIYINLLKHQKPKCIIISNDHHPDSRALMIAAKHLRVKCIYFQHASVTEWFPPMRASHALLYGKHAENIYRNIGDTDCQFLLLGNQKFDGLENSIKHKVKTGKIGVAYNRFDDLDSVLELCELLASKFGTDKVIVRPHPADKRVFSSKANSFHISNESSSINFLSGIDVLIAGNSSIILEAASMNVWCICYSFKSLETYVKDYYGFIREGLAIGCDNLDVLIHELDKLLIKTEFTNRWNARNFDASIGTEYEFGVADEACRMIGQIINETVTRPIITPKKQV